MKIYLLNYLNLNDTQHADLLSIRNLPHIKALSANTDEITMQAHKTWLKTLSQNGGGVQANLALNDTNNNQKTQVQDTFHAHTANHTTQITAFANQSMLTKYYFAVIADGKIVGGVHFINDNEPKWGLFFKPKFSPFGISAVAFYFLDFCFSLTDTLYAMVQNKNQNALKFDLLFGFSVLKIDAKFHTLVQTKAEFNKHKQTALMQKISKTSENFKIEFC